MLVYDPTTIFVRGGLILPIKGASPTTSLQQFFVCLIDLPTGIKPRFSLINPKPGDDSINYQYNGRFSALPVGVPMSTYVLPIFPNTLVGLPLYVVVSDLTPGLSPQKAIGNPNSLRPPIIEVLGTPLKATNIVIQSLTNPTEFFIVVVTETEGNTPNIMSINKVPGSAGTFDLECTFPYFQDGEPPLVAAGVIPSALNEFTQAVVYGPGKEGAPTLIDYSTGVKVGLLADKL